MALLSLRSVLVAHGSSLDQLRRDRNFSRPASALALAQMTGSFCGFPDPPNGIGSRPASYTLKDHRRKSSLTWIVGSSLPGLSLGQAAVLASATWQRAVTGLNLNQVQSGSADITIVFANLQANKLGNTLPDGTLVQVSSTAPWVQQNPTPFGSVSLLATVTHELGHALGLLHSTSDGSVMNPLGTNVETLTPDDVNGIKAIYGWEGQRPLPDRGTDRGPALCACGTVLAMAWKGIGNDHRIFFATSADGLNWSPQQIVTGVGTDDSPSLAWDGAQLWMAWKGDPGDSGLFYATTTDPRVWPDNPGQRIPNVGSSRGPSIAMTPTPMLAWKGVAGDSGIYFSVFNALTGVWPAPSQPIGGIGTSDRPALITDVTGQPLLVWKGIDGDSNLFWSTLTGIFWQPQQPVSLDRAWECWSRYGGGGFPWVPVWARSRHGRQQGDSCVARRQR